jgi:hypothetical protein
MKPRSFAMIYPASLVTNQSMFPSFVNTAELKTATYAGFVTTELPFLCFQFFVAQLAQYQI